MNIQVKKKIYKIIDKLHVVLIDGKRFETVKNYRKGKLSYRTLLLFFWRFIFDTAKQHRYHYFITFANKQFMSNFWFSNIVQ